VLCRRHPIDADHTKARTHLWGFLACVVETILLRPAETPPHGKHWTLFACMYSTFFRVSQVRTGASPTQWYTLAMPVATQHPVEDQFCCTTNVRSHPVPAGLPHTEVCCVNSIIDGVPLRSRWFRPCAWPRGTRDSV